MRVRHEVRKKDSFALVRTITGVVRIGTRSIGGHRLMGIPEEWPHVSDPDKDYKRTTFVMETTAGHHA